MVAGQNGHLGIELVQLVEVLSGQGIVPVLIRHRSMVAPTAAEFQKISRTAIYLPAQVSW